jgi:hypothetical protein
MAIWPPCFVPQLGSHQSVGPLKPPTIRRVSSPSGALHNSVLHTVSIAIREPQQWRPVVLREWLILYSGLRQPTATGAAELACRATFSTATERLPDRNRSRLGVTVFSWF